MVTKQQYRNDHSVSAIFLIYYINTSEIPNHFTLLKGAIYYVTITTVISSHVKITCYLHMCVM